MTNLRWFLQILCCLTVLGYCTDPRYYDNDMYDDCFQGAPGWYHLTATCIFPLTQFERNFSTAIQMCGAVNHSIGYRETNWLIASQLLELFTSQNNPNLMKMYWTELRIKNETMIGVESEDENENANKIIIISDFTSIFNPLWAQGQPSEDLPSNQLTDYCIALDLRNSSYFGWKALPCSYQLPILCQSYACLPGTFRCVDNSKCIPASFQNDGYKDCLDGSDEQSQSSSASFLSDSIQENPVYDWPMIVSNGGVLSPTTVRYGRGECTHRWTVLSPNDQHFMIWVKWLSPTTSTVIYVEGKEQNGRILMNSRNSTSSITLLSSSFVLTASDTDTRKVDFQIYFQESDTSLCKITENNQLFFNSESIPMPCHYHFATKSLNSYSILLIRKCEGTNPIVSTIQFNNSTVTLTPTSSKKLLILPTNSLDIHINSTWPNSNTKLDIQFLELEPGAENVDVFLVDSKFEIEWIAKSNEICMEGQFRTLTVNMILTGNSETAEMLESKWKVEKFRKSCSEDNVQIISKNQTTYVSDAGTISGFGPTTVVIHQSAEPFEFHSIYKAQENDVITETSGRFLDENNIEVEVTTTMNPLLSTTTSQKKNDVICKLPIVVDGYIRNVSDLTYTFGTTVTIDCAQGYMLDIQPYILGCTINGVWIDDKSKTYNVNHPTVQCLPINCPNETSFENESSLPPDNYNITYGTIRKYQNITNFNFGPFCICGDVVVDQWRCYNTDRLTECMIPNACILPQATDAIFIKPYSTDQNVFSNGDIIQMNCLICPSIKKVYTCYNGLWRSSDGNTQEYDSFQCKCSDDPDFIDPCKPHGYYVQHSGFYSCFCDNGYKFGQGTCVDIDECKENTHYCDGFATCLNTDGGFKCICPSNFHTYSSRDMYQWHTISSWLIDGYSCVETTCTYQNDWFKNYGLVVIPPPDYTTWYKSGSLMEYSYVTNLCETNEFPCVFQFQQYCIGTTWITDHNPISVCAALNSSVFRFGSFSIPSFHIFQMIDLTCALPFMIMIGRPKVFCNSRAQWEVLPQCIYPSCSDPTQFINQPLFISRIVRPMGVGFEYQTVIYFECEPGYTLIGDGGSIITCVRFGSDLQWTPEIPKCIPSTTTSSSTPSTSPFVPPWTTALSTTRASTISPDSFILYDDVVIEGSMIFEEKNALDQQEIWTKTADWMWTPSGCIVHQWTFPISFLVTSTPILLNSDQIELLIDVSQCNSSVQMGVTSSTDGFIPPISDFRPVMNTTSSGSFVVKLRNLKPYLALSITSNGYIQICGITIRENMCNEIDYNGLHLTSSRPFSMRRYLPATCGNSNRITPVNGYCDSRRGWVIQNKPCLCDPKPPCTTAAPIPQHDQSSHCTLNSCQNGICQQFDNYFDCFCNELFIRDVKENGEPYCKPNHCLLTSKSHNSGYQCETGEDDNNVTCQNATFFGDFCQYRGTLYNSTYTYLLGYQSENAIATNVCGSVETVYAIPDAQTSCVNPPPTPPVPTNSHDGCDICAFSIQLCTRDNPPFYGGAYCLCENDWFGRSCAVSRFCFDSHNTYLCQNGGTCESGMTLNETICHCLSNFTGKHCETALEEDNCEPGEKDCVNGTCQRENDEIYCNCHDGYIRDTDGNCTIIWDMCSLNNPCQQNGICEFNATIGEEKCDCKSSGWLGNYCEIQPKYDDCSVCEHNEECFDSFSYNVRCQCSFGYSGNHCLESTDDCRFEPCLNSGTCNIFNYKDSSGSLIESYNCTCPTGYSGTNCEMRVTPNCSDLITCQNGGTCELVSIDTAVCNCTNQFFGTYCEKNCTDQCAHSYGCTQANNGSVICECYDGFLSNQYYCDVVDDVCKANVLFCQNSGTCNSTTKSCDCPDYFNGTYCEKNENICETNSIICENGGTCIPENGKCECPPNYTGDLCENQIHSCRDITCFNGGTCIEYNATCKCLPGSTGDRCQDLGQPCTIFQPDGTTTPYCLNGGMCLNLPNGAACDCTGTDFSGRRCEIKADFNFNLVFNGLPYAPDIVSKSFSNSTIVHFTVCSFVQYNHPTMDSNSNGIQDVSLPSYPPWLAMRGYGNSQQIVFDNNGFFICDAGQQCSRARQSNFKPTPITANTWHHFCIVSPDNQNRSPNYTVFLDGLKVYEQLAGTFNPGEYGHLLLAPSDLTDKRFVGMISMTQLYTIRLTETQIGQLAFDCYETLNNPTSDIANTTFVHWNGGFTRVSSSNPGVFVDSSGICKSVKCMFGRQVKTNNYNSTGTCDKDRISPTVLRCPLNIQKITTEDFIKVEWSDEEVSFFDNIGVVKIEVNYHNGQQFGIGITAVRYVAFDAAGNSAECTFDVIITQKVCPSTNQVYADGGKVQFIPFNAPFASKVITVECNDNLYPVDNRPIFYVCDIMGNFQYGGWVDDTQKKFYLPACGKTLPAKQEINGTVVGSGSCQQVYQKLQNIIWSTANCGETSSCRIMILPACNETTNGNLRIAENDNIALQYTFSTSNATETISTAVLTNLQSNFTFVRQDSTVDCNPSFPIHDTSGDITICVSCPEGTYANTTANQCLECPLNTYRNSTNPNQFFCTPCPGNTITGEITGAVDESQCYQNCDPGQYESKGSCHPCAEGTFAPTGGLRKCISCGFDLSTFGDGQISISDCTKTCDPGQEMIRSELKPIPYCQDCATGFYKTDYRGPCIQCPRGLNTSSTASKTIESCNVLNCIDANTMRNVNITVRPNTPYSELCITCEQGTFQNVSNSDHCLPCSELSDDATDVPVTCQSTCSAEIPTEGCNCQLQSNEKNSMIIRNCLPEVSPVHKNSGAIKIVLPIVFGVLLIIIIVVLFCFRKQIIAWFRKTDTNDNQHVALSHWNNQTTRAEEYQNTTNYPPRSQSPSSILVRRNPPPPTIPRPNLRIVTSREEMDQLPPLPSSSTPSFKVDSAFKSGGFTSGIGNSSGMRHLGSAVSTLPAAMISSNDIFFEANGSPKIIRSAVSPRNEISSDDSSLDSFF